MNYALLPLLAEVLTFPSHRVETFINYLCVTKSDTPGIYFCGETFQI